MASTVTLRRSANPGAVPTSAQLALGELAINTYDGKLYLKKNVSGTETVLEIGAGGGGGGSSVTISSTAPAFPAAGDLWWDSDVGILFIYYNDGTSSQWVQASHSVLEETSAGAFTLTGSLTTTSDLTVQGTLYETSDSNLKTAVSTITSPLDTVQKLRGVDFTWKQTGQKSMGMIAQEVETVLPHLVHTQDDGIKVLHYTALIGLLIESIKELENKVNVLGALNDN